MTEYEKEIYIQYLKTIPKDVPLKRDVDGRYFPPPPDKVFNIDGKRK